MKKLNSLQVIRTLAFLGVMAEHSGVVNLGPWGVSVFLVLSGFIMSYIYDNRTLVSSVSENLKFSIKKIKKLYVLHILIAINMLVAFAINYKEFFENKVVCFFTTLANFLLIQSWIPIYSVYFSLSGQTWYLSVCVFLYFMFPFILKQLKKISNNKKIFFMAFTVYVVRSSIEILLAIIFKDKGVYHVSYWFTYVCPLFRLGDFYVGCCAGYLFRHYKIRLGTINATLLEALTFILIFISQTVLKGKLYPLGTATIFLPSSVLLVYLFALNKGWISRILTCKPLVFIGDISGHMFLIHMIVIRYFFVEHVPLPLNQWTMMFSFTVVTVIASVFYIKAEKYIVQKWEKDKHRKQGQP